jgi:O-antigen ligase
MRKLLDKAIVSGLLAAVVFTTLALGTVEAWSIAIFELMVVVLVLLWAAKAILEKRLEIRIPPAALPLGGLVLVGLVQSIALTGSAGQTSSLSMDVEATRGAVAVIFFLVVSFLIAANFFDTHQRLRTLATFLIIFGLALAVFALVQHFTWEGKMFWIRPAPSAGAGGPFVNRNHFAGYMEMLIPIPVALALSRAVHGEARLFYGFAAAIMGMAEVASLSRGGIVSLTAGMLFVAAASARLKHRAESTRPHRRFSLAGYPALFVVLIAGAIVAGVFWVGADSGLAERLAGSQGDPSPAGRPAVWSDTLKMFGANPILGVGVGAFETVYPTFGRGDGSLRIEFAHNDYLQVLSDGGVVGGALALWFIIVVFRSFAGGLKSRDPLVSGFALGAGAGIFAILVHSLFDFNLQIPSNALLFLVLCAAVSGVGATSKTRDENGVQNEARSRRRIPSLEAQAIGSGWRSILSRLKPRAA